MLNITTAVVSSEAEGEKAAREKVALKQYVLEKLRTWVNSLLEAKRDPEEGVVKAQIEL